MAENRKYPLSAEAALREGQVLTGPLFSEPMRVETVRSNGTDVWVAGLVGQQSEQFRRVTLTSDDISNLTIADAALSYEGDGRLLRIGLQAYSLGIAYEFDPYFGLSISRVDPLPHQLEAVYEHLIKLPTVRFLLADDAGAGKTIMAGLLIRELKLRGLIERVLVVCPANLAFQWQRELKEKFDEKFLVLKGSDIRDQFGVNQWLEQKQVITSLDFAKRTEILPGLQQVHWDLVIVDEAHRMSARDETHKSQRYRLGELLRDSADHMLGTPVPRVIVADQQKRWGSCNQRGTIRLNWRIIQAPMRLIDYVVVHELVHLRHRGHGRDYWQAIGRVMPDYERRREELRQVRNRVGVVGMAAVSSVPESGRGRLHRRNRRCGD